MRERKNLHRERHRCARLGVALPCGHNLSNSALLRGASELGIKARATPQSLNRADSAEAWFVAYGDRFGLKRSTPATYLRDACETGLFKFADGARVSVQPQVSI